MNQALAKKYWPDEDPIGKQIRLGAPGNYLNPASPIVGVVGDTPDAGLDNPPIPTVFMPMRVAPWWPVFTYVIRTSGPPEAVTPAVRRELRAAFPMVAIRNVQTMESVLHDSVAPARLSMRLVGAFAIVALITAALGVFGVLSFVVAQRTRELGIRMALGAAPGDVRRMVIAYGGRLAAAGLVIGLLGLVRADAAHLEAAVRRRADGPGHVRVGVGDPVRHWRAGELDPGSPRDAHRPDHGAALRLDGVRQAVRPAGIAARTLASASADIWPFETHARDPLAVGDPR